VYCEKPVTHTFREGQQVYREVQEQGAIFQTGCQQRSDWRFRRAVELVRNGQLGRIRRIEVGLPPGYAGPQGDTTVTDPPEHLDYDWWGGPAPRLPYMRARHHRWWRGHTAYGGGVLMDWIGHHNDIAHWALGLDASGPERVEAVKWTFPQTEVYDTPHQYEIQCDYPGGVRSSISSRHTMGTKFIGEDGWVHVTRGRLQASEPRWAESDFQPGSERVYVSGDHIRNFLDGVRSRQACVAPAEAAHRSITPGHLGYVSQSLGRPLRWDPENEVVIGDPAANRLLQEQHYREPWG
jgi:predicted dehydrogenase